MGKYSRQEFNNIIRHFMQIVSLDDSLHEIQILFSGENKKTFSKCRLLKLFSMLSVRQSCAYTMPDFSKLSYFPQDKQGILNNFFWGKEFIGLVKRSFQMVIYFF